MTGRFGTNWRRLDGPGAHAAITAVVMVPVLIWVGGSPWLWGGVNAGVWAAWEAISGVRDGKGPWPWSGRWGWRKRSELAVPVAVGFVLSFLWWL